MFWLRILFVLFFSLGCSLTEKSAQTENDFSKSSLEDTGRDPAKQEK